MIFEQVAAQPSGMDLIPRHGMAWAYTPNTNTHIISEYIRTTS